MQPQTTAANTPILVHCEFSMINQSEATLSLSANCAQDIFVSAISLEAGESFYLHGASERCAVADGEVLAIVARYHYNVIACGIYQVSCAYHKMTNTLLIERCASNLDFTQADKTPEPRRAPEPTEEASTLASPLSHSLARSSAIPSVEKAMLLDMLMPASVQVRQQDEEYFPISHEQDWFLAIQKSRETGVAPWETGVAQ